MEIHIKDCWRTSHNVRLEAERAMSHSLNFLLVLSPYLGEKARGQQAPLDCKKVMVVVLWHERRWNQAVQLTESMERNCGVPVQPPR